MYGLCVGVFALLLLPISAQAQENDQLLAKQLANPISTRNGEPTCDGTAGQWNVPANLGVSPIGDFGQQPVQLSVGGRVHADSPAGGPDWGLRAVAAFLFPVRG